MTPDADSACLSQPRAPRADCDWGQLAERLGDLTRAGIPLPDSLRLAAASTNGSRQDEALRTIAGRLDDGVDLPTAVRDSGIPGGETLSAALEAGYRSGDLYSVLQPISEIESVRQELQRRLRGALIYPVVVLALGAWLFAMVLTQTNARFAAVGADFGYPPQETLLTVSKVLVAIPLVVLLVCAADLLISGLSHRIPMQWWGRVRRASNDLRYYGLFSHLAILVDHDVPLPEALDIAGAVAGGGVQRNAMQLADLLRTGQPFTDRNELFRGGPPVVRTFASTLLVTEEAGADGTSHTNSGSLSRRLHDLTGMLAESVSMQLDALEKARLVWVTFLLGLAVLGYALLLFGPLAYSYTNLALDPALLG